MAYDPFGAEIPRLDSPAQYHAAVTPSDSADLDPIPRALRIGGAGNIALRDAAGTDVTYQGVAAGEYILLRARRVLSTGTTATNIVAIW